MIKTAFPTKVTIIGSIKAGYTAAKIKCSCGENLAVRIDGKFHCKSCKKPIQTSENMKTFPLTTGYFIIPPEVAKAYGERPTELNIIPAYPEKERSFYTSFRKVGLKGQITCKGDGSIARRIDETGKEVSVKCEGEYCEDFKNSKCKYYGSLVFFIPEVDILNAYRFVTHSKITITNILSTLERMSINDRILQVPCTLKMKEVNTGGSKRFYVVELIPPSVPISLLKNFIERCGSLNIANVFDIINADRQRPVDLTERSAISCSVASVDKDEQTPDQETTVQKTENEADLQEKERVMAITITRLNKEVNHVNRTALINYIELKAKKKFDELNAEEVKQILRRLLANNSEHYKYFVLCDQIAIKSSDY